MDEGWAGREYWGRYAHVAYAVCTTNGLEHKCPPFLRTNPVPPSGRVASMHGSGYFQLIPQQPVTSVADQSTNIDILSNWVQEQAKSNLQREAGRVEQALASQNP